MKKNFIFRMLFLVMSLATLSYSATSCSNDSTDDGTPTLEVSQVSFEFNASEHEATFTITSNRDWTATSSASWLTITPNEGSGNETVTMSMSATEETRYATIAVSIYNTYGVLSTANVSVSQIGTNGAGNIVFDGSELPTSYSTTSITINAIDFAISNVANYSSSYEVTGLIQFKKGGAYIYNTTAIEDLTSVAITLSNSYNNFTVFSGTAENPTTTSIEGTTDGSLVTYTIPEGDTYVSIYNNTDATDGNTAYADYIEFVIGDNELSAGDSTGNNDEDLGDGTDQGVIATSDFRTKALVGNYCTLENVRVDFKNGSYVYVSANGVSVNVYSSESDLVVGNIVTISGEVGEYYSLKQLTSLTSVEVTGTSDVAIEATEYTVAELVAETEADVDAITAQYVKLSGVSMSSSTISQDGSSISWYTSLGTSFSDDYETYTVYGYVSYYNTYYQLLPTEIIGEGDEVEDPYEGLGVTLTMEDFYDILIDGGLDPTSPSSGDLVNLTSSYTIASTFNFDFSASTGSTLPRLYYYNSSSIWQIRTYGGSSNTSVMTISTADGTTNITDIIFTINSDDAFTVDSGTFSGNTWSGSATSVTFTGTASAQITAIQIITDGEPGVVGPNEEDDVVVEPTYTTVAAADFYSTGFESGDLVTLENMTVDFVYGSYVFASNNGTSIYFYTSGHGLLVGQTADISGTYNVYSGAIQVKDITTANVVDGTSTIEATEYTAAALTEVIGDLHAQLVTLKGVDLNTSSYLTDDTGSVAYYNSTLKAEIPEGYDTYTVTGYVYISNYGNQIYPTLFVGEGEQYIEPVDPDVTVINAEDLVTATTNGTKTEDTTIGIYSFAYTATGTATAYYSEYIRLYQNSTMTISTTDGSNMTSIVFEFGTLQDLTLSDGDGELTIDGTTGTWTGSASSLTFTAGLNSSTSSAGRAYFSSISIK